MWLGPPVTLLNDISIVSVSSTSTSCTKSYTGILTVFVLSPSWKSKTSISEDWSYLASCNTLTANSDKSIGYELLPTVIINEAVTAFQLTLIFEERPPLEIIIELSLLNLTSVVTVKSPFKLLSTLTIDVDVSSP